MPDLIRLVLGSDFVAAARRGPARAASRPCSSSCSAGRSRSRSRSAGRTCASSRTGRDARARPADARVRRRAGARPAPPLRCSSSTVVFVRRLGARCSSRVRRRPASHARRWRREGARRLAGSGRPTSAGPASPRARGRGFLRARGHEVEVVTTAAAAPARGGVSGALGRPGSLPPGVRHVARRALGSARRARARRRRLHDRDVRPQLARRARSRGGRTCVKLTADPAFERARRRGLSAGDVDAFRLGAAGSSRPAAAPRPRRRRVRGAAHVVCPSAWLRELAIGWGVAGRARHRAAEPGAARPRELPDAATSCSAELGVNGRRRSRSPGRLTAQKSLEVALEAVARGRRASRSSSPATGPEREPLERHAASAGSATACASSAPRRASDVLELFRAADAALLSSALGELPARASSRRSPSGRRCSRRAPAASPRSSRTARTGCSSSPATPTRSPRRSGASSRTTSCAARLRAAAAPSVADYAPERVYGRARGDPARRGAPVKPRVLFVGRTRYSAAAPSGARAEVRRARGSDSTSACSAAPRPARRPTTHLRRSCRRVRPRVLDGPLFYALAPVPHRARAPRASGRRSSFAQSPFEGAAALLGAARWRASRRRSWSSVHGDWRASTRLYGSTARGLLGAARRPARRAGRPPRRRRARAVGLHRRASSRELGVEPAAVFTTYSDLAAFTATPPAPLPEQPTALFVGVLERYKNVDGLAAAWRLAAPRRAGRAASPRRPRDAARDARRGARRRPARADELDAAAEPRRGRGRAGRGDAAPAPLALGGDGRA